MINIIAAIDSKNGIGKNGQLLFKIPEDFKRMKNLSMGHPIVMGRKTYESIGRVLPGRTNIIITHDENYTVDGGVVVHSLEEALDAARKSPGADEIFISREHKRSGKEDPEIFIFGGGEIFKQVIHKVDRIYLTKVEGDFNADTFFPDYSDFKKIIKEESGQFENLKYKFLNLER